MGVEVVVSAGGRHATVSRQIRKFSPNDCADQVRSLSDLLVCIHFFLPCLFATGFGQVQLWCDGFVAGVVAASLVRCDPTATEGLDTRSSGAKVIYHIILCSCDTPL